MERIDPKWYFWSDLDHYELLVESSQPIILEYLPKEWFGEGYCYSEFVDLIEYFGNPINGNTYVYTAIALKREAAWTYFQLS
jgi:hypothetical protein